MCNNSKLVKTKGGFEILGDPTEGSLIVLGKKGKLEEEYLLNHFSLIEELPFDSDRKRMSVIFKNKINKKTENGLWPRRREIDRRDEKQQKVYEQNIMPRVGKINIQHQEGKIDDDPPAEEQGNRLVGGTQGAHR
ncbi:MAG: hypothetical protein IIC55_04905 [Proteobacteria bacterium]|nr:hypothetical protein [Pseudomonadota bacterium]